MSESMTIILLALFITGATAFVFELVIPHAENVRRIERLCEEKGGIILDRRNSPDLCIKKEMIIK